MGRVLVRFIRLLGVLAIAHFGFPAMGQAPRGFTNPVRWEDLADLDIIRVGSSYYYSASNMHYSPGAPILRSTDLIHWDYVGHSLPVLDFSSAYSLDGGQAYVKGSWASFLGYRSREKAFYWGGCIEFKKTYIYTAPQAEGPWKRKAVLDHCYYDAGLLVDDDDQLYVAHGRGTIEVAQLSRDGTKEVRNQAVFSSPKAIGYIEGSRFYKRNGNYYILVTHPPTGEYVLRSTTGPFGPYEAHLLVNNAISPIAGAGAPHQGGIVNTPDDHWFYMAFTDAYPGGRVPVLAPIEWTADGWPSMNLPGNVWESEYPLPVTNVVTSGARQSPVRFFDSFSEPSLSPEWEWNHNPDNRFWSSGKGLRLETATVTDDLYKARNTLTHRIPGPQSEATADFDLSGMREGDCTGLSMLRDVSGWIGVERLNNSFRLVVKDQIIMDKEHQWDTTSKGSIEDSLPISVSHIWLRVHADIRPGKGRTADFSWSKDGKDFSPLGPSFLLDTNWHFFLGYRFALFNYATKALGGVVEIQNFTIDDSNSVS